MATDMTHHSEPAEAVARIIKRVQQYDTPKMDDHRRRYTPAQLEMAVKLALSATPAPSASGGPEAVRECLIDSINQAETYLSQHIETYHDYEDDTPERASLRGIQHHLIGSLIADDGSFLAPAVESAQVKEAGPSLGSRLNHAALTIRGLSERIALMRESYTSNSALDHGRRQILDDFEKFLRSRASLATDAEG